MFFLGAETYLCLVYNLLIISQDRRVGCNIFIRNNRLQRSFQVGFLRILQTPSPLSSLTLFLFLCFLCLLITTFSSFFPLTHAMPHTHETQFPTTDPLLFILLLLLFTYILLTINMSTFSLIPRRIPFLFPIGDVISYSSSFSLLLFFFLHFLQIK